MNRVLFAIMEGLVLGCFCSLEFASSSICILKILRTWQFVVTEKVFFNLCITNAYSGEFGAVAGI
jgi:hypothetical protein